MINVDKRKREMFRSGILEWAGAHLRDFPWRNDENRTPYRILVAELLLKRTTATAAAKIYEPFLAKYPDPVAIAKANVHDLEKILASIGLQKQRANGFKAMAQFLINHHSGLVPDKIDQLKEVPQVGEYAARAILSFGYGRPAAVVDSNVVRVLNRLFARTISPKPSLAKFQSLADMTLPIKDHQMFNWAVLDLGALVCRYDRARCESCPLTSICDSAK